MKIPFLLALAGLTACESLTETAQRQPVRADLTGVSVRPTAVSTTGAGSLIATIHALNGEATVDYSLEFSGLVGNATSVHLHGPAGVDATATILVNLAELPSGSAGTVELGAIAGTATGTLDLRLPISSTVSGDSLHKLLDAGLVYIDVHTDSMPSGEIRGQILKR
jgi:hypothetical protein